MTPIQVTDLAPNVETAKKRLSENLDAVVNALTQLGVPPKLRDFVGVLLAVSNGQTRFEASYRDIASRLSLPDADETRGGRKAGKARVKRLLVRLADWQTETGIELMRIVKHGKRTETAETTIYEKTIFELALLEPLARAMMTPPSRRDAAISRAVTEVLSDGATVPTPTRPTPTIFKLERAIKTILTKADRIEEYAAELGLDALERIDNLIAKLNEKRAAISYQRAFENGEESINTGFSLGGWGTKTNPPAEPLTSSLSVNQLVGESLGAGGKDSLSEEAYIVPEVKATETYAPPLITIDENKFNTRDRAFGLARSGFFVLPLHAPIFESDTVRCSCRSGLACGRIGKHPRTWHGVADATRDPEKIKLWFEKWKNANLAIATGKRSNLLVLDVDGLAGAFSLDEIEHEFSPLPETIIQRTGKPNGRHFLFSYPDDATIRNSAGDIGNGLDIRSDGGYICADPSIHASGKRYEIENYAAALAAPPAWFVGLLLNRQKAAKINAQAAPNAFTTSSKYPAFIGDGVRNETVFRYGCGLVNSFSPAEKLVRVRRLNETRVSPPLDEIELLEAHLSSERLYRKRIAYTNDKTH
jgi:hypothetical protein